MKNDCLIIGAGVAGMSAALTLADGGAHVFLAEKQAAIGGWAAQYCCKATDTCSNCSVCTLVETIGRIQNHPNISIVTNSTLTSVHGRAGDFKVEITNRENHISPAKCLACRACLDVCPAETKAIFQPFPSMGSSPFLINETLCRHFISGDCQLCRENCPVGAIDFAPSPIKTELNVPSIIVATGFDVIDAKEFDPLGYGRYPNVLTGIDLERSFSQNSFTGSFSTQSSRRVAFVQCVGSRSDKQCYCSQVCCKYAIRFARLLKYRNPETLVSIFYIDLQTAGKGFADFYAGCKDEIRFIRGKPIEIAHDESGGLKVRYEDIIEARVKWQSFDLIVLSVGMIPRRDHWDLAKMLGINLNQDGFFEGRPLDFVTTNVEGIFLAGACQGPKDIPYAVAQGTAAAKRATEVIYNVESGGSVPLRLRR